MESSPSRKETADSDALLAALSFTPNKSNTSGSEDGDWSQSPLDNIISFLSDKPAGCTEKGVRVPPLLQELFGVEYLPREGSSTSTDRELEDLQSVQSDISLEVTVEEDEQTANDDSITAEEIQASFDGKQRKRQTAVGKLKSRVIQAKERRKQKRRDRLESRETLDDSTYSSQGSKKPPRNATWIQKQKTKLDQHKAALALVQQETLQVETRIKNLSSSLKETQQEVAELDEALSRSMASLEKDARLLQQSKKDLKRLEAKRDKATRAVQETASCIRADLQLPTSTDLPAPISSPPRMPRTSLDDDPVLNPFLATPKVNNVDARASRPLRQRADSEPASLRRVESSSFIRIHDLPGMDVDSSSLSEGSSSNLGSASLNADLFFLDDNVATVLRSLAKFGHDIATDESDRFLPVLNTEKALLQCKPDPSWHVSPWYAAYDKEVFVWVGSVDHKGHGCDLPVVKARGIIPTEPRNVLDLVMDSSRVGEYNKMSQGRHDIVYLQKGIDTTELESEYGLPGEAKIIKSLNKPPLIRRSIEMLSLLYARRLEHTNDGYLTVSRSVWEDSSGSATSMAAKDTVRSEILLGVNVFRPVAGPNGEQHCEMTTITHAHTTAVPDMLARKMGPSQAVKFFRDLQVIFSKNGR